MTHDKPPSVPNFTLIFDIQPEDSKLGGMASELVARIMRDMKNYSKATIHPIRRDPSQPVSAEIYLACTRHTSAYIPLLTDDYLQSEYSFILFSLFAERADGSQNKIAVFPIASSKYISNGSVRIESSRWQKTPIDPQFVLQFDNQVKKHGREFVEKLSLWASKIASFLHANSPAEAAGLSRKASSKNRGKIFPMDLAYESKSRDSVYEGLTTTQKSIVRMLYLYTNSPIVSLNELYRAYCTAFGNNSVRSTGEFYYRLLSLANDGLLRIERTSIKGSIIRKIDVRTVENRALLRDLDS